MKLTKLLITCVALVATTCAIGQTYLISDGGTVNTCSGTFYDSGGAGGGYADFEFYQMTICSDNGDCLSLDFTFFETNPGGDLLFIYDGPTTADPVIDPAGYSGSLAPFTVEGSTDCLTLLFFSGFANGMGGWEANISCAPCPSCTDGIQNGSETGIDCGGSTCPPCPCDDTTVAAIPFNEANSTCGAGNNYNNTSACFSFFMNGEDYVYEYTPTASVCLQITLDYPNDPGAAGLFVTNGCPDLFTTTCVLNSNSAFGSTQMIENINVTAGVTYYIIVSSDQFQAPCMDYTITIDEGEPNIQDCLGAIPVCDLIQNVATVPTGNGACLDLDPLNTGCLTGELNSIWFTFGIANDGILNFTLTPDVGTDDFDWGLYDLTGGQCSDIIDDPSTLISCNSYGVLGVNGPTGISASQGGFGSSNGPGNLNGPPFNDDVWATAGNVYTLLISNWSGTPNGFTLDFSESDPGIFGFTEPTLNESITDAYCSLDNGAIDITGITGGLPPYDASINGNPQPGLFIDNLFPGQYTLEVTTGSTCVFAYDITVGDSFVATNAGVDTSQCDLDIVLSGETLTGFMGSWSGPAGVNFDNPEDNNATVTSTMGGDFILTWTLDDGNGCVVSDEITITFTDEILIDVLPVEESCYEYCDGTAEVFPSGGSGGTFYTYEFSDGSPGTAANEAEDLCSGIQTVTVTDANGCQESTTFEIIGAPVFQVESILSEPETCPGDCDGILIIDAPTATTFSADGGATFVGDSILTDLCPGEYSVIVRNDEDCLAESEATVGFHIPPTAGFTVDPPQATLFDATFSFLNQSIGDSLTYEWLFGFTGSSSLQNPTYTFVNASIGEYPITLLVTDSIGCQDTLVRNINIIDEFQVYTPNAFTPDGDGVNEEFYIVGTDIDPEYYFLEIYDRWGRLVFETIDIEAKWNGSNLGGEHFVQDNVFVWRLKTKSLSTQDEYEFQGSVTMFR